MTAIETDTKTQTQSMSLDGVEVSFTPGETIFTQPSSSDSVSSTSPSSQRLIEIAPPRRASMTTANGTAVLGLVSS